MQVAFYLAGEITQVKESIPWVRCASGNVSRFSHFFTRIYPRDPWHSATLGGRECLPSIRIFGQYDWFNNFPFSDAIYLEWTHFKLSLFVKKKFRLHKGFSPQIYLSEHLPLFKMLSEETEFGLRQTLYSPQHQQEHQHQQERPSNLIVSNADDNLGADESKTSRKNRTKFNPFQVHFDIQWYKMMIISP